MPTFNITQGDALEQMRLLPDNSIDSIVTDPPYGLSKQPDMTEVLKHWLAGDDYQQKGGGFMGKSWDSFVPGPSIWKEAFRVLKPGGHLLAFAGSRTQDLMGLAIRLGGFEIRDSIEYLHDGQQDQEAFFESLSEVQKQAFIRMMDQGDARLGWLYGSGFPKSQNISLAMDKAAGAVRTEVAGVKPGHEEFAHRTTDGHMGFEGGANEGFHRPWMDDKEKAKSYHFKMKPATDAARQWDGWGSALKPAHEPIIVARKPFKGTLVNNILTHGVGGLNVDGCRVGGSFVSSGGDPGFKVEKGWNNNSMQKAAPNVTDGRFPANIIHDGSQEVLALFPESTVTGKRTEKSKARDVPGTTWGNRNHQSTEYTDNGSTARFFYCAKASSKDRHHGVGNPGPQLKHGSTLRMVENTSTSGNTHPTVKPTSLMQYLVRLVTPRGGTTLDMFCGSGSTGRGAVLEGVNFIGFDQDASSVDIANKRVTAVLPEEDGAQVSRQA
ncbi:MAG: site-specific DNA-methyltransferase [Marinospirillum sp.]|uniref:DNA methyltransferase n=1 Tax=Marinospirillum sp. TaxID=2183934 RepID=UPI001A0D6CC9|nr:DNA methyltransferase [Marinospirillum sp.]MBE0506771.1 site-specific DNA-methyltransferase [Marinospirillum sp.]